MVQRANILTVSSVYPLSVDKGAVFWEKSILVPMRCFNVVFLLFLNSD